MERRCRFRLTRLRCKARAAAVENIVTDQADGLRRLMAGKTGKQLAVVDCDPDRGLSGLCRNLAAAFRQQGQEVLPLTEHDGPQPMPSERQGRLTLIDAALDSEGALSPSAARSDHVLVAFQANAASITRAYLCIKNLHHAHALQRIRVLVYGAADAAEARQVLSNLSTTGRRYLAVTLEPAGWIRADRFLAQARGLDMSVVDAFPASPAACDFRQIASKLLQWPGSSAADQTAPMAFGRNARGEPRPVSGVH